MKNEKISALAKSLFGKPPKDKVKRIGYNVAVNYFGFLIEEAEIALKDFRKMETDLPTNLKNAFEFSSYGPLVHLGPKAHGTIIECADRFKKRYEPLLEKLELRAA